MNLKKTFILYFLLVGLIPLLVVITIANFITSAGLQKEAINKLNAVTTLKKQTIESYFNRKLKDLELFSSNKYIQSTLKSYNDKLKGSKVNENIFKTYFNLFDEYVRNNINFGKLNYHDLFIIDTAGNIIYTFAKEDDLKTNLISGKYKNTNLAKAFRKGLKENFLSDMEIYTPSNKLALFAASPIYDSQDKKKIIGVMVIQADHNNVDQVMEETTGLGTSGETYLVGSDYLLKSNLKLNQELTVEKSYIEKIKIKTEAVAKALSGKSETKIIKDYRGIDVLSCYTKLNVKGLDWVIISEIDKSEALAPVNHFLVIMIIFLVICFFILLLTGAYTASLITKPINYISDLLSSASTTNLDIDITDNNSKNELSKLQNTVNNLTNALYSSINNIKNNIETKYNENITSAKQLLEQKEEKLLVQKSKLKEYKDQLKVLFDEIDDGIAIFNLKKGKIINVNLSFCTMFRCTKDDLLSCEMKDIFPQEFSERLSAIISDDSVDKQTSLENIKCLKRDGKEFFVDIDCSKISYNNQLCLLVFFKDKVKQETSARHIEKIISTLSENIREPLLAENLVLKYLLKGAYGDLTKKETLAVENMLKSNQDLITQLNVILDFYNYEYESIKMIKENINIYELIIDCLLELSLLLNFNKDKIKNNLKNTIPSVNGDKKLLKRLLINIIGNIINYLPENISLIIDTEITDQFVILKFKNNEIEYPENDLDQIFSTYYAKSKTFNKIAKGLSLYLSKQIIHSHSGELWLEKDANKFYSLNISLPLQKN